MITESFPAAVALTKPIACRGEDFCHCLMCKERLAADLLGHCSFQTQMTQAKTNLFTTVSSLVTSVCTCQILYDLQQICKKTRAFQAAFHTLVLRRVRKIAMSDYYLRHVCPSTVRLSAWNNSALTGQIFIKCYI